MELPNEALYIMIPVILLAGALALVGYLTKNSRNFRSSRNRRARRQHHDF
jgi:Tfp pilus assembly protein PilV